MRQQDIVLVKFPFSNVQTTKVRPAVVVSNNRYNESQDDVLVCGITSKLGSGNSLRIKDSDLSEGRMHVESEIRADKLHQLEKSLILKKFAKLNSKAFDKLTEKIIGLVKRD